VKLTKDTIIATIRISGKLFMFAIALDMYAIVGAAFLYGHSVNVHFNAFAEAYVEYFLFLLMFPIIVASLILDVRAFRKEKKERRVQKNE